MRHTLIPPQERLRIHHEYHIRLLIVSASVLSVAVLLGVAGLSPAYMSAWSADHAAVSRLTSERGAQADSGLSDIDKELAGDKKLLGALSSASGANLSDIIRGVVAARSSVQIFTLNMGRQSTSTVTITMSGSAPTRSDLLSFKNRLEGLPGASKVNLPIDVLKKDTDVPFSIQLTQRLP